MDNCFAACSSEGVTTADLDRFTDKIENVLNDQKGRRLFADFMFSSKMRDGRRALVFWEKIDKLLNETEGLQGLSFRRYLRQVDGLMEDAERVEELDFATMERLATARDSENREEIEESLKILKVETTKALRREFNAFRRHYVNLRK